METCFSLLLLSSVGITLALSPVDNRLQQELDMGSPSNLAATAVAAAMEGDDDFGFEFGATLHKDEDVEAMSSLSNEDTVEETSSWPNSNVARVQRLWGIPDTSATVGKLFSFSIPSDAFSGDVDIFKASSLQGKSLPKWVTFKPLSGHFEGVPSLEDLGEMYVKVQAHGMQGSVARDVFAINVVSQPEIEESKLAECLIGQDRLQVSILVDAQLKEISAQKRVTAVKNLAGFLGILSESVVMETQDAENGVSLHDESVVDAGAGNVKRPRTALDPATVLRFPSNCAITGHPILTERLQALAKDGTLAEVLQLPVIGWLAQSTTQPPPQKPTLKAPVAAVREKRQIEGSGDSDNGDYDYEGEDEEEEEEEDDEEDGVTPDAREIPTMASPTFPEPTATTPRMQTIQHPHRHHHGEDGSEEDEEEASKPPSASPGLYASIVPTPVLVPVRPTKLQAPDVVSSVYEPSFEPSRVGYEDFAPAPTPSVTPGLPSTTEEDYGDEDEDGLQPSSATRRPSTSLVTEPLPPSSSTQQTPSETTTHLLEPPPSSTEGSSSAKPGFETVEFETKNFPPTIHHRLRKVPVVAGKALRFVIPEDTFQDLEDGGTRKLRLIFKSAQGTALPPSSWIQFNPETQEVYALPVEEQVSKWNFDVEAMDKEGKTVTDSLELVVQQHKGRRNVNHEFTLQLRIEQKFDFPSCVDWQLNVLNGLTRFFGDRDESHITVINATSSMSAVDKVYFTWTNDSLSRHDCDNNTLKQMYDAMTINERGEPSMALKEALGDAFKVKQVTFKGISQCENVMMGPPPPGVVSKQTPLVPPVGPVYPNSQNFAPVLRNHVDHLNATVGQLLVYRVPEDTFYDPEDGSTRNMKLSLLTMNRQPVDPGMWLQFDVKNQEFYGVPSEKDRGRKEYQLVCEDNGGLNANDGLVVVVHAAPSHPYNVEFRMTLSQPTVNVLEDNAATKRRLMERLGQLFGDPDARNLVLAGLRSPPYQHVKAGPTPSVEVLWYNISLPREKCPQQEVAALRRLLVSEEAQGSGNAQLPVTSLGGRVREIMKPEFPVMQISMFPTGLCQGESTFVHTPATPEPPSDDDLKTFGSSASSDEYLITYIVPAVVIAAMLLLAGLVACALYRRRRRGKLAVGESGPGAPGFRSRGIPVIFQDELDEKAIEPVAKSPVIMKNEKPPLPPPEYPQNMPSSGHTPHATPPMHQHRQPTAEDPLLSEDPEASPYQPPPPFTSNRDTGRQNRPKPTPTYRKPPPYVPP